MIVPAREAGRRCAVPNYEYFSAKADFQRRYLRRYLYSEYEDACRAAGESPYAFNTFCRGLAEWRRSMAAESAGEWFPAERMTTYWADFATEGASRTVLVCQLSHSDATVIVGAGNRSYMSWMRCCAKAYEALGGVPYVTQCPYPNASRDGMATLEAFAAHFRTVLYGARPKSVKTAVRDGRPQEGRSRSFVADRVRADIRYLTFHSAEAIDETIIRREAIYNATAFGGKPSRKDVFEKAEMPLLLSLPKEPYGFPLWLERVVGPDHHFIYRGVRYSVPWQHVGEEVRVEVRDGRLRVFSMGREIASHEVLAKGRGRNTVTDDAHRPPAHRAFASRMDDRFIRMAEGLGSWAVRAMKLELRRCRARGMGFRSCKELIDLSRTPSSVTLDDACRAVIEADGAFSVGAVRVAMGSDS